MGILGKDLFDLKQNRTHTRIEFGVDCYWVESFPEPIPYGAILTEILNCDIAPFQRTLDYLEHTTAAKDLETVPRAFTDLEDAFASLPLYRLYLADFRLFGSWQINEFVTGEARDAFAEDIFERAYRLPEIMQERLDELQFIQRKYTWFLETMSSGAAPEKKKGQRKIPLAEQIMKHHLEPYVSGVSLGENLNVDAPPVNIQYAVRETTEGPELVERVYFDHLTDFVYVEFMRGLQKGFVPKRCANCGQWFLQTPGVTFSYCDGPAPGETNKTCRDIGAGVSFHAKVKNNEVWQIHQRAYKKYYARVLKKAMTKAEFELWARNAERLRDQALDKYENTQDINMRSSITEELRAELNP